MGWQVKKLTDLPLGTRIIRMGMQGADVLKLQTLLSANGFFSGVSDGVYGVITALAVRILQQTFGLRVDGVAGPQVIEALLKLDGKSGRILHRLQPGENIAALAAQWGVTPKAWYEFFRRRPGLKRIYPGMQLLLHQKALFLWEEPGAPLPQELKLTGRMETVGEILADGAVDLCTGTTDRECYSVFHAKEEIWQALATSRKLPGKLIGVLRKYPKWGLDLRNISWNSLPHFSIFLRHLLQRLNLGKTTLLVLSLPLALEPLDPKMWQTLHKIGRYSRMMILEPQPDCSKIENFITTMARNDCFFSTLFRTGLNYSLLILLSPKGWNWDENGSCRIISFPEIKRIRALHGEILANSTDGPLSVFHYWSEGRNQELFFRDSRSWRELTQKLIRCNFAGIVMCDWKQWGDLVPELVMDNFSVLPEKQLHR